MTIPNKTSKYVWAYQAVVGTSIITAVNSLSYEFGEYNEECGKWNNPFVENKAMPSWVYSSRTPTLTDMESEYPNFSHVFLPVTAQPFAWIQGKPISNTPSVDISSLETDMTYPLTIRNEELGGTRPNNAQAVDCYCVGLTSKAERGKSLLVECIFAFGALEDIGDNPNLTTAPLKPGELMSKPYNGNPLVTWDTGGDNNAVPGVWRADWSEEREAEKVSSDEGATQITYTYKLKPVRIILSAVFQTLDPTVEGIWKDYMDRKASTNMTIKVLKHNNTNFILATFTNCRVYSVKKSGDRNKGHYGVICILEAEKVTYTNDWFTEGGANFANHWKANI